MILIDEINQYSHLKKPMSTSEVCLLRVTSQKQRTMKPTGATTLFLLKNWPQIAVLQNLIFLPTSYQGNAWSLKSSMDSALAFELPSLLGGKQLFPLPRKLSPTPLLPEPSVGLPSSPPSPLFSEVTFSVSASLGILSKIPAYPCHSYFLSTYSASPFFSQHILSLLTDHTIYFLVLLIVLPPPQSIPVKGKGFKVRDFGHFVHCLFPAPGRKHRLHERL